jgi:hypothetical protein
MKIEVKITDDAGNVQQYDVSGSVLCHPKGSAKKVFNEFWKKAKNDTCDRKTLASISFDAGHLLRHQEYEKALWWYNLSLSKKKSLFNKRFFDDKFDMNKIHKEIITILYELHCAPKQSKKEIVSKISETDKIIKDFKLTGQTIRI